MYKLTISIFLMFCGFGFYAQNTAEDMNKVRSNFIGAKQIGFDVEVHHYKMKGSKGELISKGKMRKSGDNYYSSFMDDKMIINERKGTVIIDKKFNEITYKKLKKKTKKKELLSLPDSLFDQFKFSGKYGNNKKYEYKSVDLSASILRIEILINEDYQLNKVIYYYNRDNDKVSYGTYKVEIAYKNIITSGISSSYFDIGKIINFGSSKPKLTKQYANYTLLN